MNTEIKYKNFSLKQSDVAINNFELSGAESINGKYYLKVGSPYSIKFKSRNNSLFNVVNGKCLIKFIGNGSVVFQKIFENIPLNSNEEKDFTEELTFSSE